MQLRATILCLVALGVVWIAMSSGPPLETPHALGRLGTKALEARSEPQSCKPCKDRAWCACTREGRPRTSCEPCCYQGPNDALPICVD